MKQSSIRARAGHNQETAKNILKNLEELNEYPNERVRIQDDVLASYVTNPVEGEKSPDSVYRKLSRARRWSHKKPRFSFTGLEGALDDIFNNLQTEMENRTMNEETYNYILKTPTEELILEKINYLNTKYNKVSA